MFATQKQSNVKQKDSLSTIYFVFSRYWNKKSTDKQTEYVYRDSKFRKPSLMAQRVTFKSVHFQNKTRVMLYL